MTATLKIPGRQVNSAENIARSFARRFAIDVYCLRLGDVIEPHEYERDFPAYIANPPCRKRNAWSYIDARDLGLICDLCVKKDWAWVAGVR